MQVLAEVGRAIVCERFAIAESAAPVKCEGRFKGGSAPCFETEAPVAARLRLGNDVFQQDRRDTLAQMRRRGAHGFDFPMVPAKRLQRAHAEQVFALPRCIETDVGALQARKIECENTFWRAVLVHAAQMQRDQVAHTYIIEIAGCNAHALAPETLARQSASVIAL